MQKISSRIAFLTGSFALSAFASDVDIKHDATRIGAWIDAGQVWQGELDNDVKVEKQVVTRSKVALTQVTTVNDRLTLTGAVGGLFFYSLPIDAAGPHTRLTKFNAVLEEASGLYKYGDLDMPFMEAKFGLFFEKYNPDSKNLGEYLYRSGTYPGYLQTGGWYILNNAGYFMQGLKTSFNLLDGDLRAEGAIFMERDWEPTYDLTPSLMVTYKPGDIFQLGVGMAFNHLIPAKPSITTPEDERSAYKPTPTGDSLLTNTELFDTVQTPGLGFYSFQGIKAVARASFNLQSILQSDLLNPEDLKFYAEMAILGIKDYPIFYDDISKRMPLMFGVNLPTFKLVDMASFEVEYYNSDFPNSLEEVYERTLPVPGGIGGAGTPTRFAYVDSLGTQRKLRDKVKWSFWLNKKVVSGLSLYFQVASDHFRPINFNLKPSYQPVTQTWNDWYYMFRLNFGI